MFSPKVLDRANVVEFKPDKNDVLGLFTSSGEQTKITPAKTGVAEAFLRLAKEVRDGLGQVSEEDVTAIKEVFETVYDIVEKNGYEFAYRTVREIRQYIKYLEN